MPDVKPAPVPVVGIEVRLPHTNYTQVLLYDEALDLYTALRASLLEILAARRPDGKKELADLHAVGLRVGV